jgi:hypothetical protein
MSDVREQSIESVAEWASRMVTLEEFAGFEQPYLRALLGAEEILKARTRDRSRMIPSIVPPRGVFGAKQPIMHFGLDWANSRRVKWREHIERFPRQKWPAAVDWVAPEIRGDRLFDSIDGMP